MEPQSPQSFRFVFGSMATTSVSAPSASPAVNSALNDSANSFKKNTNLFKEYTNLSKESANLCKDNSSGAPASRPEKKPVSMGDNSTLELRRQSFARAGWSCSEAQQIYLAALGFYRLADGVVCSGCSATLQRSMLPQVLDAENTPWKEFHEPDCQFLCGKTICGICRELIGVSATQARRHVYYAHIEPRLLANDHEYSQLSSKPLSQVSPAPAPAPARPQYAQHGIAVTAPPPPQLSQEPFGQNTVLSPQKNLSLSKVGTVASIEPSSHVLAIASFDAGDKALTIAEMSDFSGFKPILTALEVFTRMTRKATGPTDTTAATNESLPPLKKSSRLVTLMTRSEFDTLRLWAIAVQGLLD